MENSVLLAKAGTEKIKKKSAKERQVEAAIKNEPNVVHLKEQQLNNAASFKLKDIVWLNVIAFMYIHLAALYGLYQNITLQPSLLTYLFTAFCAVFSGLGITAGAHRLWTHRCYKATWSLRLFLMIANTLAFQNSIWEWVRDHRVHHKYTETNADPHNANRGFFFSHMGWLLVKKHPDVKAKGSSIDMTDLDKDSLVMLQKKHYVWFMPLICFVLPTFVVHYLIGDSWSIAWHSVIMRWTFTLHGTWLVNSLAHFYGMRPYDKYIQASENIIVAIFAIGEGWHNYHHIFPWDYKAAELGNYNLNWSTAFIDFCAKLGLAYELKSASHEVIERRALRTGDGDRTFSKCASSNGKVKAHSEQLHDHCERENVWGWDDKDLNKDDRDNAIIIK